MTGACMITSTCSSVFSSDRSSQRSATYISAKTDTPCIVVSLRQLSSLFIVVVVQPEFVCTQSGRVVHRRRSAIADDGNVDLTYDVILLHTYLLTH